MIAKRLPLVAFLSLVASASTAAEGSPAPNLDPERLRGIVQAEASKRGVRAVEFGVWQDETKILTMALGPSMTTVPATTDMHYRIGGIAETFMSTLLLMLVEQGKISLDDKISRWLPDLLKADEVTVRMLVANTAGYVDYVRVHSPYAECSCDRGRLARFAYRRPCSPRRSRSRASTCADGP